MARWRFRSDDTVLTVAYAKRRAGDEQSTRELRPKSITFPRFAAWRCGHARGRQRRRGCGGRYTPGGPVATAGYLQGWLRARTTDRRLGGRTTQCDNELAALLADDVVRRARGPVWRIDSNVMSLTLSYKSRRSTHNYEQSMHSFPRTTAFLTNTKSPHQ